MRRACTRSVWTGQKQIRVRGFRQPLYRGKVTRYSYRYQSPTIGAMMPNEIVSLFNAGKLWWLSYGYKRNTGAFKSKKDAIHWWEHGGR